MMLSQARILLAMARDGLLPPGFFAAIHPRFRTPHYSTILVGIIVAVVAALLPLQVLAELVNIGTLFAFVIVCAAVLIMRYTRPDVHRPFRTPFVPVVPILGMLANLPSVIVVALVAYNVIHHSASLALAAAALLLFLDVAGWRMASAIFGSERLIVGRR
jgi:APA family basic amino acid/polyamine antiporter